MMNDRRLAISEQNHVILHWRELGFEDEEFEFTEEREGGYRCTLLIHRPSDYRFFFTYVYGRHAAPFGAQWTPPTIKGTVSESFSNRGEQILRSFKWLERVHDETRRRNLWAEIKEARTFFSTSTDGDNTPLAEGEIRLLTEGLDTAERELVEVLDVPPDAAEPVHRRFEYLRQRLRTLGRLDVTNLIAGQILQIIFEYAKDRNVASTAFGIVQRNLHYLVAAGQKLLGSTGP
jgi:hypothetical protein